jgi:hypothetical protein
VVAIHVVLIFVDRTKGCFLASFPERRSFVAAAWELTHRVYQIDFFNKFVRDASGRRLGTFFTINRAHFTGWISTFSRHTV